MTITENITNIKKKINNNLTTSCKICDFRALPFYHVFVWLKKQQQQQKTGFF